MKILDGKKYSWTTSSPTGRGKFPDPQKAPWLLIYTQTSLIPLICSFYIKLNIANINPPRNFSANCYSVAVWMVRVILIYSEMLHRIATELVSEVKNPIIQFTAVDSNNAYC